MHIECQLHYLLTAGCGYIAQHFRLVQGPVPGARAAAPQVRGMHFGTGTETSCYFGELTATLGVCSCSALENHIYQDGVDSLRRVLCNELTDLCRMHDLHDHGEL